MAELYEVYTAGDAMRLLIEVGSKYELAIRKIATEIVREDRRPRIECSDVTKAIFEYNKRIIRLP